MSETKGNPMVSWKVYLHTRHIDTVWFTPDCDAEYVKQSLIEHDGYHPAIFVARERG
jgi:hypothetical protein